MPDKFPKLILLLALFIFTNANAQFEKIGGMWINEDSIRIGINEKSSRNFIITNPTNENEFNFWDYNRRFAVQILRDTLRFGNENIYGWPPIDTVYFENFHDFKIITSTDSTLVIFPISPQAIKLLKNTDTLRLVRKDYQLSKSVTFEKIVCNFKFPLIEEEQKEHGRPYFYLEIDNKKNIYIDGTFYKDIGSTYWGYPSEYVVDDSLIGKFKGVLSDSIYNEIVQLLKMNEKYSSIEAILTDSINSPTFSGIIYSKNQQKFKRGYYNHGLDEYYLSTMNKRLKLSRVIEK